MKVEKNGNIYIFSFLKLKLFKIYNWKLCKKKNEKKCWFGYL